MTPYFVSDETNINKEPHMREMVSSNPYLPFEIQTENRTVLKYQERLNKLFLIQEVSYKKEIF